MKSHDVDTRMSTDAVSFCVLSSPLIISLAVYLSLHSAPKTAEIIFPNDVFVSQSLSKINRRTMLRPDVNSKLVNKAVQGIRRTTH